MRDDNRPDIILIEDYLLDDDNGALGILWKRYKDDVYNAILSKLNFDEHMAADMLQDCFIRFKSAVDRGMYKEEKNIKGWMITMSKNLVIDYHRGKGRIPSMPNDDGDVFWNILHQADNKETEMISKETSSYNKELLERLLGNLSHNQRSVIEMRYFQKLSYKEISEKMDQEESRCRLHTHYGIIRMRKLVENKAKMKSKNKKDMESKSRKSRSLSYDDAREALKPLGIKTAKEFQELKDRGALPSGIPMHPYQKYKVQTKEWQGWKHFLGVEEVSSFNSEEMDGLVVPRSTTETKESTSSTVSILKNVEKKALMEEIHRLSIRIKLDEAKLYGLRKRLKELG